MKQNLHGSAVKARRKSASWERAEWTEFGEAAIFTHLLSLNETSPGWEISTLAGQHNPGKMV